MYIQPVQHACPGTSLLMGDSTITVAGVISAITAITAITLSLSACTGYQYTHVLGMDTSPACQQHVGTNLQLWVAYNTNNTNNICFAPMPWASRHPAYDAQGMYLPCFRMLHILWVAACSNHGKGVRLVLWHKARHWWLPHSLGIFALVQGHAHSLEQPGQCRVATAYSLCVPSM